MEMISVNLRESKQIIERMHLVATSSVDSVLQSDCVVLFSGGIDSSVLATLVQRNPKEKNSILICAGLPGSADMSTAIASGCKHQLTLIPPGGVLKAGEQVKKLVRPFSLSSFEDCVSFFLIFESLNSRINELPGNLVLAANGPDELFCGYDRFRRIVMEKGYAGVDEEINRAANIAYRLGAEVEKIASYFGLILKQPFLEPDFVEFGKNDVPSNLKINRNNDFLRKRLWRQYGTWLGLPDSVTLKPKKAMQYSMGIHKAILSLFKSGELSRPEFENTL